MSSRHVRWIIVVIVVLAIVALLAYRRNDPGDGGRVPDPEDVTAVRVLAGADGRSE
ncbi:MAG: hypothetical protein M5T61_10325 [Acidimicrobiia bacterium]|nr:hypothetical protein [Acidimicrobiia bacterium]